MCLCNTLEKWHTRYNFDETVLEQREVVGNVNDDMGEELLKQVGNAMHTVLGEFNAVGHDEEVSGEVGQRDVGGRRGKEVAAEAGGQRLQPLPQQIRPASPWLGSGHQLQAVTPSPGSILSSKCGLLL